MLLFVEKETFSIQLRSAYPAPFLVAFATLHVIAPTYLFCTIVTVRTSHHVMVCHVVFQLKVSNFITSNAWMRNSSTFKAHNLPTFTSSATGITPAWFLTFNVVHAFVLGAPLQVGVHFNVDILLKLQILSEYVFTSEFFDILLRKFLLALMLHAPDSIDLPISNLRFQVITHAVATIFMRLTFLQSEHILVFIAKAAYIAKNGSRFFIIYWCYSIRVFGLKLLNILAK